MFFSQLIDFMASEWVFIISVAGTVFAVIALIIQIKKEQDTLSKKIFLIITIIFILICLICVTCFIFQYCFPNSPDTPSKESSSIERDFDSNPADLTDSSNNSKSPTKLYPEPSAETEKWGYVDGNDNIIIPFIYDWADDFIDGYAAVCLNGKYGFIDKSGNEMIAFNYNMAWSFMDGLAPVYNGDKWGFIDENGILKIPFKYTIISRSTFLNGKQAYIDENDNVIDYENETSSTSSSSSSSSSSLKPTSSSTPSTVPVPGDVVYVPVSNYIQSYVSTYRNGSKLTVMINKGLRDSKEDIEYPFNWGLQLKDNLNDNDKVGEYVIELVLSVNEDGSIVKTDSRVLITIDDDEYNIIKEHLLSISADFDGENYVVTFDITNDYIDFDKICVVRYIYY